MARIVQEITSRRPQLPQRRAVWSCPGWWCRSAGPRRGSALLHHHPGHDRCNAQLTLKFRRGKSIYLTTSPQCRRLTYGARMTASASGFAPAADPRTTALALSAVPVPRRNRPLPHVRCPYPHCGAASLKRSFTQSRHICRQTPPSPHTPMATPPTPKPPPWTLTADALIRDDRIWPILPVEQG